MAEKKFLLSENQRVWDSYYNGILDAWKEENKELTGKAFTELFCKKKVSIAQYKSIVVAFEQYTKKPFNDITAKDIEAFSRDTEKKSKLNHLNSFLVTSITNGNIKTSEMELLISLLPDSYKKLGRIIAKNKA